MTDGLKEHYRPDELARALDVSPRCIYRWIRAGLVCYIHAGKYLRIPRQEYLRLLKDGVPIAGPARRK